jgi:hypothetical protein
MIHTETDWRISKGTTATFILAKDVNGHDVTVAAVYPQGVAGCEMEGNANLIKAAPKMAEALKAQHEAIDMLFAMLIQRDKTFFPSKSGQPWEAMVQGNQALAEAEGKGE